MFCIFCFSSFLNILVKTVVPYVERLPEHFWPHPHKKCGCYFLFYSTLRISNMAIVCPLFVFSYMDK